MVTSRDESPRQERPLVNKKRTSLSLASDTNPEATTQRDLPEQTKKRKGVELLTWKTKFQKR